MRPSVGTATTKAHSPNFVIFVPDPAVPTFPLRAPAPRRHEQARPLRFKLSRRFDLPDLIAAVVRYEQAAVGGNRHTNRAAPALKRHATLAVIDVEAGHEVLERPRLPVRDWEECHAGPRPYRAIPRAVQRHESSAAIALWKLRAGIEGDAERGRMRRDQDVRDDRQLEQARKR